MRPGVPHLVVSLTDCFFVGTHYYSQCSFSDTLRSLVFYRFHCELTNEFSDSVQLDLLDLFRFYSLRMTPDQQWVRRRTGECPRTLSCPCGSDVLRTEEDKLPESWPEAEELAYLLVLVDELEHLKPMVSEGAEQEQEQSEWWTDPAGGADRRRAKAELEDVWSEAVARISTELEDAQDAVTRWVMEESDCHEKGFKMWTHRPIEP
jgi:hypothetical protein